MDVRLRPFAVHEADRLDELREAARLDRAEAMLGVGDAEGSVEALQGLTAARPLDEHAAALLMRALYAGGRQAEALAVYHRIRTALDDELGVDPGPELDETQRLVLAQDATLRGPAASPAAAPLPGVRVSVPAALSRLVGRTEEIAILDEHLAAHRLVTITGPGGVGKTRLSTELATRIADRFPDGVQFVDLSGVTDAGLIPTVIAEALDIELDPTLSPDRALVARLHERRLLLVLDNLEQIGQAGVVVARLLSGAGDVRIVATSRVPLLVRGEMEFALEPLALPDGDAVPIEALFRNDAVALFMDHVAHHGPTRLTEANRHLVIEICRRLDGLPLALELVAARTRSLSLEAVNQRLEHRLDIAAVEVDLPDRQRTLRDTIAWSVELLSPASAALFRRLGALPGGWTLETAEDLADPGSDAVEALDELVRQSLVRRAPAVHGAPDRFAMLETIREFAATELERSTEADSVRERAIRTLTAILQRSEERFAMAEDQAAAIAASDAERTNVRAMLDWAASSGRDEPALRLAAARHFWALRGLAVEGRDWLQLLLARDAGYSDEAIAQGRTVLASLLLWVGDLDGARREWETASRLWTALGVTRKIAAIENNLGIVAERQDDLDRSRAHAAKGLELMRELGDQPGIGSIVGNLGVLALRQGDLDAATRYNEEALAIGRAIGHLEMASIGLSNLGLIAARRGDTGRARGLLAEALELNRRLDDAEGTMLTLESLAELSGVEGDVERQARLHGGIERLREQIHVARSESERREFEGLVAKARVALGDAAFDAAWQAGGELDLGALIEHALEGRESSTAS